MATAKSPAIVAIPSPLGSHERGRETPMASYFPQQQQQQLPQQDFRAGSSADAETLSNTLANSQVDYGHQLAASPATRPAKFTEEWDASQRGSSIVDGTGTVSNMHKTGYFNNSTSGVTGEAALLSSPTALSRGNTLKKKASLRRSGSLKRSGSRRSMKAGSVRSLVLQSTPNVPEIHSAFYCPVPTSGNPAEILANRFQAWRKILKDLITYFREIQTHYEHRGKSLLKLSNVINNTTTPPGFLSSGGLDDALQILRNYNKQALVEASKAREIEEDVIMALMGLRSDLHQKIKEIKNLSGDFKSSVEKEMENTRRAVNLLQDALGHAELDADLTIGKQDPYLLRLSADRQLERQIDEENYLHQAYLNLQNSGRELESIVVGEIQKAYNAYAGILKREADTAYSAIEKLRLGPISMAKDTEWVSMVHRDDRLVDPDVPMRSAEFLYYPGRDHYSCQEIRAGLLERKSKYLRSYTAGWYVLSPTHLHEFKSADKAQGPVVSLYLPEQKLGSHSTRGSSSNKFVMKGRQTGSMHRGHTWVFRAESYDTMMAWYEDIKTLTERTPEERSNLVRGQGRSNSRSSGRSSLSSDGVDDDEDPPFTATVESVNSQQPQDTLPRRPSGGRFPSDLQINAQRGLQVPVSPLSVSSGYDENAGYDGAAASGALPSGYFGQAHSPAQGPDSSASRPRIDVVEPLGSQAPRTTTLGVQSPSGTQPAGSAAGVPRRLEQQVTGTIGDTAIPISSLAPTHVPSGTTTWAEPIPVNPVPVAVIGVSHGSELPNGMGIQGVGTLDGVTQFDKTPDGVGSDDVGGDGKMTRPDAPPRSDSIPTISHLHVPGEYPRGSTAGL